MSVKQNKKYMKTNDETVKILCWIGSWLLTFISFKYLLHICSTYSSFPSLTPTELSMSTEIFRIDILRNFNLNTSVTIHFVNQ